MRNAPRTSAHAPSEVCSFSAEQPPQETSGRRSLLSAGPPAPLRQAACAQDGATLSCPAWQIRPGRGQRAPLPPASPSSAAPPRQRRPGRPGVDGPRTLSSQAASGISGSQDGSRFGGVRAAPRLQTELEAPGRGSCSQLARLSSSCAPPSHQINSSQGEGARRCARWLRKGREREREICCFCCKKYVPLYNASCPPASWTQPRPAPAAHNVAVCASLCVSGERSVRVSSSSQQVPHRRHPPAPRTHLKTAGRSSACSRPRPARAWAARPGWRWPASCPNPSSATGLRRPSRGPLAPRPGGRRGRRLSWRRCAARAPWSLLPLRPESR